MGEELSEKGKGNLKKYPIYVRNELYAAVKSINLKRVEGNKKLKMRW